MLDVIIIGAGPGGLSAAGRAQALGMNYLLLEASDTLAKTIFDYQKQKPVMAEPSILPLRSDFTFEAGTREQVLSAWQTNVAEQNINIRLNCRVSQVEKIEGRFEVGIADDEVLTAKHVVLALGLQGNPRTLGVAGESPASVQYTLVDASEYRSERIVIIGAGDAAIENALALAEQNSVVIVNRRNEFARAKDGNLRLIKDAIESGRIECVYGAQAKKIEHLGDPKIALRLSSGKGTLTINCDRIIARLGAVPPRPFLEGIGIAFPNQNPNATPELDQFYQSSVAGLYVIGALAGNPLIKQAMNQGYEVIQAISGQAVEAADHHLLDNKLSVLPYGLDVNGTLALLQKRIPFFGVLSTLQFRELLLESQIIYIQPDSNAQPQQIFAEGDYADAFVIVVDGCLSIQSSKLSKTTLNNIKLNSGQFFGELSLNTGLRQTATGFLDPGGVVVSVPRRAMVKLINSNEQVKQGIEYAYIARAIQQCFCPDVSYQALLPVAHKSRLFHFSAGELVFDQHHQTKAVYIVRTGLVSLLRGPKSFESIYRQVRAGDYFGELSLLGGERDEHGAQADAETELVEISEETFQHIAKLSSEFLPHFQATLKQRLVKGVYHSSDPRNLELTRFLLKQGLREATDILIINDDLCVGCDNCETACAETHAGVSRLDRAGGKALASMHVPIACRHCDVPHCMKDCPPDAIKRELSGEVFIEDSCIGCGNCVENCPYDVIKLAYPAPKKPSPLSWLFLGRGKGPGQHHDSSVSREPDAKKKAVKCDACRELKHGPACVSACPTGAAIRIAPPQFDQLIASALEIK